MARKKKDEVAPAGPAGDEKAKKGRNTIDVADDLVEKLRVLMIKDGFKALTPWVNLQLRKVVSERWRDEFDVFLTRD